mmetsp:Transcript_32624/g.77376  ORF Transcript_32624/g.77376 Transcript_32624/m.77376 type:complete len:210 (-) Transcript_32624:220-849(-)
MNRFSQSWSDSIPVAFTQKAMVKSPLFAADCSANVLTAVLLKAHSSSMATSSCWHTDKSSWRVPRSRVSIQWSNHASAGEPCPVDAPPSSQARQAATASSLEISSERQSVPFRARGSILRIRSQMKCASVFFLSARHSCMLWHEIGHASTAGGYWHTPGSCLDEIRNQRQSCPQLSFQFARSSTVESLSWKHRWALATTGSVSSARIAT